MDLETGSDQEWARALLALLVLGLGLAREWALVWVWGLALVQAQALDLELDQRCDDGLPMSPHLQFLQCYGGGSHAPYHLLYI